MRCVKSEELAILFLFFAQSSIATTVLPRTTDDLAVKSPIVVMGKVVEIDVSLQNGYRTAIVEADEVVRAPAEFRQQRDFLVPLLNRAIPHKGLVEVVPAAPELLLGEEVVLFLRPIVVGREGPFRRNDSQRLFGLEGFQQGKLRVFRDNQGVRRVASWSDIPEIELSGVELQKQKSTPRLAPGSAARTLNVPAPLALELRTLDSVLNLARGNAS